MKSSKAWDLVEEKILELRSLTDTNWRIAEWELAALGERILRSAEISQVESEKLRADAEELMQSLEQWKENLQYRFIIHTE